MLTLAPATLTTQGARRGRSAQACAASGRARAVGAAQVSAQGGGRPPGRMMDCSRSPDVLSVRAPTSPPDE